VYTNSLLKMTVALSVFTGIIGAILFLAILKNPPKSPRQSYPTPSVTTATPTPEIISPTPTDLFCGGIAGKQCPAGYSCKYDNTYPDASGKCIKKEEEVVCTLEAKQCPDGSWVGRQGPKCEFTPCPKPN